MGMEKEERIWMGVEDMSSFHHVHSLCDHWWDVISNRIVQTGAMNEHVVRFQTEAWLPGGRAGVHQRFSCFNFSYLPNSKLTVAVGRDQCNFQNYCFKTLHFIQCSTT